MEAGALFAEREHAFEALFKHSEALRFRIKVRRNKLIGMWAAERLGLAPDIAELYAMELVWWDEEAQVPGDADLVRHIGADLEAHGLPTDAWVIRNHLQRCQREAYVQIMSE